MDKKLFTANPNLKEYHETSDGNKFYTANDARHHAKRLEDKKVVVVTRNDAFAKADTAADQTEGAAAAGDDSKNLKLVKPTSEERIALIESMETVEEITAALKGEKASTVKEAGAARIAALTENKD